MKLKPSIVLVAIIASLLSGGAQAARRALVVSEAVVKEGPGPKHRGIAKLKKGEVVAASNLPVEGFYKIRTRESVVGWVPTDAIEFSPSGSNQPSVSVPLQFVGF